MPYRKDYMPGKDADFDVFFHNATEYVDTKTSGDTPEWPSIKGAAASNFIDAYPVWHAAYVKTLSPHTPVDTLAKNDARKSAEKIIRPFVSQYLRFPPVTDEDRRAMGIPNRDTIPTNHPPPDERPIVIARAAADGKILVEVEGTWPPNAAGVKYYWEITDEPDPNPANLRHSTFKNKLKHEFVFEQPDWGKKIHFACAFENGKGDSGPLSAMVSTIVP
ncbi:MAG: hypothetical protein LBS64_02415 [Spirochaetaceae bacterium]|jgi:hypothetical protein|nr:hypothetical protein [Spirochaetaceae bacterium]